MNEIFTKYPHRRFNPLTGEWVKVSPHRTQRPWQGQQEKVEEAKLPAYDPTCYLCPTNTRSNGESNPNYSDTFVFVNDFSAVLPDSPQAESLDDPLFKAQTDQGICRVICFSPKHDLTMAKMSHEEVLTVVNLWQSQTKDLAKIDFINHIQIFENRGEMMGCSNPHPHGQIWAERTIPNESVKEIESQKAYFASHKSLLLMDYLTREKEMKERIVLENNSFTVLVPYWAIWPFETLVLPNRPMQSLLEATDKEKEDLAEILRLLTIKYDNLFGISFPYSMGLHQAPTDGEKHPSYQFHIHYYPPLLRSATIKKFMVGYELLGMAQRDLTPETSAQRIREMSEIHYTKG